MSWDGPFVATNVESSSQPLKGKLRLVVAHKRLVAPGNPVNINVIPVAELLILMLGVLGRNSPSNRYIVPAALGSELPPV